MSKIMTVGSKQLR